MTIKSGHIVAVDAGFRNMGIAVYSRRLESIVETVVYSTGKNKTQYVAQDYSLRLGILSDRLATIIRRYSPCCVVAEMPVGSSKSQRAAVQMAFAFAVVCVTCKLTETELHMVSPRDVKKKAGNGARSVSKADVIAYVRKLGYGDLLPRTAGKQEHVADAIACLDHWLASHE